MIAVVDYNAGNLKSVETALAHLGASFKVSSDPEFLLTADKIIFPGVGHARSAMDHLHKSGIGESLQEFAKKGKPFLGICLGSQIIFEHSEEGDTPCLGLIPGEVKKFPSDMGLKIPQIGWNTINFEDDPLMKGVAQESSFYFVHSYYVKPASEEHVLCRSEYGIPFTAAVCKDNVRATQFHPEKSGKSGLTILQNFLDWEV